MDELKKYIQQNREAIDQDEPGPELWEKISTELKTIPEPAPKKIPLFVRLAVAASLLVLAGTGIRYLFGTQEETIQKIAENHPKPQPAVPDQPSAKTETPSLQKPAPAHAATKSKHPSEPAYLPYETYISSEELNVLHDLENSFTQVINLQKERISTIPMYAETPDYFTDFRLQIKQIEKDEKSIKADIRKQGVTDELLGQLINLYQQKLSVLKQLQTEMNKTNNRFKQFRSPVDSGKTYFLHL